MLQGVLQVFLTAYTYFQNVASYFQNFTHKSKNCTHKMQNASHLLQNEALHSKYHKHIQKQTFANTFAIILISVRFLCYIDCVLCFAKVFYEIEN